jgi:hypothetical protein
MSSLKQIRANRRNAKKSTGPTTKAGKENSRFNALVHGLRAESNLLPGEDAAQFDQLLESLTVGWRPQDDREKSMIERIATAHWKLARLDRGISQAILDLDRYRKRLKRVKDKSSDDDRDFRPGLVTSMNGGPPYFDVQPQIYGIDKVWRYLPRELLGDFSGRPNRSRLPKNQEAPPFR